MRKLLINGCYDLITFQTLKNLGVASFGFDFRSRSPSLITFSDLNGILSKERSFSYSLIFENEKEEIIRSCLDLLKEHGISFVLQFRDNQSLAYYQKINNSFIWFFRAEGDWKNILLLDQVKGVILNYSLRDQFQNLSDFWDIVEARNLEVFLHAENREDLYQLSKQEDISVSFDLGQEFQISYRKINQDTIKEMKIWGEK